MSKLQATGKIYKIFETKQVSERFTKREFVLEIEDGKYPQFVLFQLTGDRCGNLDHCKEGDELKVEFNLRGREWTSPKGEVKYFNSLDIWKMSAVNKAENESAPPPSQGPPPPDNDQDIPF